jgi:hypothetical protein
VTAPSSGGSWLDQLLGIPGQVSTGISDFTSFFGAMERLGQALTDPHTYVRIFMVLFGLWLILGAIKYA